MNWALNVVCGREEREVFGGSQFLARRKKGLRIDLGVHSFVDVKSEDDLS